MSFTNMWSYNGSEKHLLFNDPAISSRSNISSGPRADIAAVSVVRPNQSQENDSSTINISNILRVHQTSPPKRQQQFPRKLNTSSSSELSQPNPRACLAGTQTMQHLVRNPPPFDPFTDSMLSDSGNYSTDNFLFPTDSNESFDSTEPPIRTRQQNSLYEERPKPFFPMSRDYQRRSFHKSELPSMEAHVAPKQAINPREISDRFYHGGPSPPAFQRRISFPVDSSHRSTNVITMEDAVHNTSFNDFLTYAPPPTVNSRQRQDLEVLEENMANVSKYVDILTDGGSNPHSRESSCVRAPDLSIGAGDVERNVGISRCLTSESMPASSPVTVSETVVDRQSFQQPEICNLSPSQLTALTLLLNNLNVNLNNNKNNTNSGLNGISGQHVLNLLAPLLASNSTGTNFSAPNPPQIRPPVQPHSTDLLLSALRGSQNPSFSSQSNISSTANSFTTSQLLNLQDALSAFGQNTQNSPISKRDNDPSDFNNILFAMLTLIHSQSQNTGPNTNSNNNYNSGLLGHIANLLSSSVNGNNNYNELLAELMTAVAATVDSQKCQQVTGYHGRSVGPGTNPTSNYMSRVLRHSPTFGGQSSSASNYHRRPMTDASVSLGPYGQRLSNVEGDIDRAATIYRNSANNASQKMETIQHWNGKLPMRNYKDKNFSRKVFLGGVPWDSTSEDLISTFSHFGAVSVLWPQKDGGYAAHNQHEGGSAPKGYCYLLFEHEKCVGELLSRCSRDPQSGGDYFKLSSPKFKAKDVQVIPWVISDSQWSREGNQVRLESTNTVFVGALHGMITAEALANIMNDLFDNVIFAALDTDKHKYPIGSGRVVFSSPKSYNRAVTANFVEVRTTKFTKTLQIDPFLEDSICNMCDQQPGVYFCRAFDCFKYFCPVCWFSWHNDHQGWPNHKPLRRSLKICSERI